MRAEDNGETREDDRASATAPDPAPAQGPFPSGRPVVVTVFNRKGGIGKTTTSVNLAVCLAAMGRRVALVDFDSQGNATTSLGFVTLPVRGSYEVMLGAAELDEVLKPTAYQGLSACCATEDMGEADVALALTVEPQRRLADAVANLRGLDFLVVDCPPALGMLPINALAAADAVLLPVTPEPMAHDGLFRAWQDIRHIRATVNPRLVTVGLVLTMVDDDSVRAGLTEIIRREFGQRVLPLSIPRDPAVVEASARDMPVVIHAPDSPASRAYLTLAGIVADRHWRHEHADVEPEPFAAEHRAAFLDPEGESHPDEARALATLRAWKIERDAVVPPADLTPGPEPEQAWIERVDDPLPAWMRAARRIGVWTLFFLAGLGTGLAIGLAREAWF